MSIVIKRGDCRDVLRTMPDQSVHCVVTSPPYWGLRDYGVAGQIGLEATPDAFVAEMVAVFREVRRVLRDDGTLWLNLGDSYAANRSYQVSQTKHPNLDYGQANRGFRAGNPDKNKGNSNRDGSPCPPGFKPKDLLGIPWRVAFALQANGWYLRQDIIWSKPNPMPESVTDRCTKAHEYIFLLAKSQKYYYDNDAIKGNLTLVSIGRAQRKQRFMDKNGVGTLGKQSVSGVDSMHSYAGLALGRNGKTGYDLISG